MLILLVLQIQNFAGDGCRHGVGKPSPVLSLDDNTPPGTKLVFVQGPKAGFDVGDVTMKITTDLKDKTVEIGDNGADLRKRCPTSLRGIANCYAAIIFDDSYLTP
ncbi:hypothetical protein HG530_014524 [Fusarium avenaceum]|nr:hypothetical protein HG530_014524 [Fusarium avenaceum]